MAEEESQRPIRLMNFVSEDQLAESKRTRGERLEDGTAQRDRPLYEILKENKDKRDAEFNERFKHRPPKALDEDETEFLDNLEMTRREYERQVADDEAQQILSFQAAVAAQSNIVHELKEEVPVPRPVFQEEKPSGKRNPASRPLGMIIKVKPQAKKARVDVGNAEEASKVGTDKHESSGPAQSLNGEAVKSNEVPLSGLVSYSDESDDNAD
ncbi:hypothetical protein QN277_021751 [Acacia crassicarpa]|uniref:FAM192A/Fyv6 N-terminal domain-containing protein n=1 Tax=Acacia crassicarpa TaxID=499986 RepID=A0AAE1MQW4_9FABA|nr:hypothetical protein QN277_021751 [Acacia crassicarpa]